MVHHVQHPKSNAIHHVPPRPIHLVVSGTEHFLAKKGITGVLGHTLNAQTRLLWLLRMRMS